MFRKLSLMIGGHPPMLMLLELRADLLLPALARATAAVGLVDRDRRLRGLGRDHRVRSTRSSSRSRSGS